MKKYPGILFIILLSVVPLRAQDELDPVTKTVAFTNVNIIPATGKMIKNGTVVISNGIISAVGNDIQVPPGAREIKADTMYLYAGFILGMSHAGIDMPEKGNQSRVKEPANPPDERAGISPERTVLGFLTPEHKSIQELRQLGFTIAQTAPKNGMLPGNASLILLKGKEADDMILRPQTALYATFEGASGMYPATILGVMAKYRQLYRQAEQARQLQNQYNSSPAGMQRPFYDRTLEAFYPVLEKQVPVAFKGPKVLEAQRAIALQNELGFKLLLTGLKEGWDIVPKIKGADINVLFSLDLPEWKEEKKDSLKEATTTEVSPEKKLLMARKEEFTKKYFSQMAIYQNEGIPFGFSSIDAEAKDIHGNFLKMIENGLSENAALAAVTTDPASILGINEIAGTVENGKMANLVISTKPYFQKDAKVRFVVIEGEVFEYKAKDTIKADPGIRAVVLGEWNYTSESPQGEVTGKINIREEGDILAGTITNSINNEVIPLEDVLLVGNTLSFSFNMEISGNPVKIEAILTIQNLKFTGTYSVGNEAFSVEGEKQPEK